MSYLGR